MQEKYEIHGSYCVEVSFFIIEEFQSDFNRWVALGDKIYLEGDISREFTACGRCWQETSVHGTYSEEYAKTYCNALNDALKKGEISNDNSKITGFRVCLVKKSFRKTPLEANRY